MALLGNCMVCGLGRGAFQSHAQSRIDCDALNQRNSEVRRFSLLRLSFPPAYGRRRPENKTAGSAYPCFTFLHGLGRLTGALYSTAGGWTLLGRFSAET